MQKMKRAKRWTEVLLAGLLGTGACFSGAAATGVMQEVSAYAASDMAVEATNLPGEYLEGADLRLAQTIVKPEIESITIDKKDLKPGDKAEITVKLKNMELENTDNIEEFFNPRHEVTFENEITGKEESVQLFAGEKIGKGLLKGEVKVTHAFKNGKYRFKTLHFIDNEYGSHDIESSQLDNSSRLSFNVSSSLQKETGWCVFLTDYPKKTDSLEISSSYNYPMITCGVINSTLPEGVSWDGSSSTLTLKDFVSNKGIFTCYMQNGEIYGESQKELNIVSIGNNSVASLGTDLQGYSSYKISGGGTLNITDGDIIANKFSMDSGILNLNGQMTRGGNVWGVGAADVLRNKTTYAFNNCLINIDGAGDWESGISASNCNLNVTNSKIRTKGIIYIKHGQYEEGDGGTLTVDNADIIVSSKEGIYITDFIDKSKNHKFFMGKNSAEKETVFENAFEKKEADSGYYYYTHNGNPKSEYDSGKFAGMNFFQITSGNPYTAVKDIKLDKKLLVLDKSIIGKLTATVTPSDAEDKTVTWSSSNTNIATVDASGNVKAVNHGTAKITAKTVNGKTATCEVRVNFADVASTDMYYYKPVYWAAENKITTGANGLFAPHSSCTREHAITFLWRMAGSPQPKSMASKFKDITNKSSYSYKAIMWGTENGIITGSGGKFAPNKTCTREQIVTMLWRLAGKPNPKSMVSRFKDVKNKNSYSYKAILWAAEKGIATGQNGSFAPGKTCTRAEIVTFIYRYKNQK